MILIRTKSSNSDFRELCQQLDSELNARYGKAQSKYDKHNLVEDNHTVIVGYLNGIPVAGGCFKTIDKDSIEIKRMFVRAEYRRMGFSTNLLSALEDWAKELGFSIVRLETGKGQPEAIGFYKKQGYQITENYGPYIGVDNSLCMKKII